MSKLNKFSNITEQDIKKHGVQALADRPNASGQYGTGGLSAQQLKEWFDQLAAIIAGKLNEIQNVLGGKSAASYIAATLQGSRYESLQDILDAMTDGNLQYNIKVRDIVVPNWPDHEDAEMVSLNQLVASISFGLETLFERVLKVYALDPIGEINFRIGSNNDDTDISLELWGAPLGRDDNDDELKVIASVVRSTSNTASSPAGISRNKALKATILLPGL